jgi:hypothetical protein
MPRYTIFVFCDHCGDVHAMGISVRLDDGPIEKKSIGDTYAGCALPPQVAKLDQ